MLPERYRIIIEHVLLFALYHVVLADLIEGGDVLVFIAYGALAGLFAGVFHPRYANFSLAGAMVMVIAQGVMALAADAAAAQAEAGNPEAPRGGGAFLYVPIAVIINMGVAGGVAITLRGLRRLALWGFRRLRADASA